MDSVGSPETRSLIFAGVAAAVSLMLLTVFMTVRNRRRAQLEQMLEDERRQERAQRNLSVDLEAAATNYCATPRCQSDSEGSSPREHMPRKPAVPSTP